MKISYWPDSIARNGTEPYNAVLDAMRKTDEVVGPTLDADAAVIWSVLWNGRMRGNQKVWQHYRLKDKPVIVVEVGALRRGITWKLSANGINRDAIWPTLRTHRRSLTLDMGLKVESPGDAVMICCQQTRSEQWAHMGTMEDWLRIQIDFVRSITDRPIMVRPHPRETLNFSNTDITILPPKMLSVDQADFEDALGNAHAVISHNNNTGPQAIIAGKRAMVHPSSLAWPVSSLPDEELPDRTEWFDDLLHTEWTVEELREGQAWRSLREQL